VRLHKRDHRFDVDLADGRRGWVRDAKAGDAKAALTTVGEVVRERPRTLLLGEDEIWTPKQWREHRLNWCPDGAWLSGELDGFFIGLYAIMRGTRRTDRHKAEFGIWLAKSARGLGFGRVMLQAGEAWASDHGVSRIELNVFTNNERAIEVYRAAGYEPEGVMRSAYRLPEGGTIDALRMAKLL